MANSLRLDLTGSVVIFRQEFLTVPQLEHPFRVDRGSGASPHTAGRALFGEFLSDGEDARMEGYMVERLATNEEIEAALDRRQGRAKTEKAVTSKPHRLWVNETRTVLFRFWEDGPAEIAMRATEADTWGPPITMKEEKT